MEKPIRSVFILAFAAVMSWGAAGCSTQDIRNEPVATVNGEDIKAGELRDILGIRGKSSQAAKATPERKREALDRLVTDRLLEQDARAKGLDNTAEFRQAMAGMEPGILSRALLSREMDGKAKALEKEAEAEAGKMMKADKKLSEKEAMIRARKIATQNTMRKLQEDLLAAAKKEVPPAVRQEVLEKIGKGEKVPDDSVLATVGNDKVTLGEIRKALQSRSGGTDEKSSLPEDPVAIRKALDAELAGKTLVAYAKKQKIEGSEWEKTVRKSMERPILINLLMEQVAKNQAAVSDQELADAYQEYARKFSRGSKSLNPQVKEQLRIALRSKKREKVLAAYIEELRKKAKITIHESVLSKV